LPALRVDDLQPSFLIGIQLQGGGINDESPRLGVVDGRRESGTICAPAQRVQPVEGGGHSGSSFRGTGTDATSLRYAFRGF
jgi:hypothetical protein